MGLFETRKSHAPTRSRSPDLSARYLGHGLEVTITFFLIIIIIIIIIIPFLIKKESVSKKLYFS
jgi:hypothetical protein